MNVVRIRKTDDLWLKAIRFAENCSWEAGGHIAGMLRDDAFRDWEAFFAAVEGGSVVGCARS